MRHGGGLRKFGRTSSHRRAMFRNLATSFLKHGHFETTIEKAKELRPIVERLVTLGREDTVATRRQAYGYLMDKDVVHKLFAEIGPKWKTRAGGYTRIVRTGFRHGDKAQMAIIEFIERDTNKTPAKKVEKKAKPAVKKAAKEAPAKDQDAKKEPAKKAASKTKGSTKSKSSDE